MESWHRVELGWVRAVQGDGKWAWAMRGVSELGPGAAMWAVLGVLFLGGQPRRAMRLVAFVLVALWLRECLALALQSPRPYWLDPNLRPFGDVATRRATYGFPSGHAWVGTAFWMYLAGEVRRPWAWWLALALASSIGFSRVYLGVHFPSDVGVGMLAGLGYAAVFRRLQAPVGEPLVAAAAGGRERWVALVGLAAVAVAMLSGGMAVRGWVLAEPLPDGWAAFGAEARKPGTFGLLGVSVFVVGAGYILSGPGVWRRLEQPVSWTRWGLRVAVAGVLGFAGARGIRWVTVQNVGPASGWGWWWVAVGVGALALAVVAWRVLRRCEAVRVDG